MFLLMLLQFMMMAKLKLTSVESVGVTAFAVVVSVGDDGRTRACKCYFCDGRPSLLVLLHLLQGCYFCS